jgi:hypothetical protein
MGPDTGRAGGDGGDQHLEGLTAAGAAPSHGGGVTEVGADACYGFRGHRCWPELKRKTRRTRWWGCGHETGVREGRTAEERLRAGRGNLVRNSDHGEGQSTAIGLG